MSSSSSVSSDSTAQKLYSTAFSLTCMKVFVKAVLPLLSVAGCAIISMYKTYRKDGLQLNKQVLENPAKNQTSPFNYLVIVAALMVTCYITSNVMAVKLIQVRGITWFDAGTITFPLAYMLGDVLTEIWGYQTARKVILLTFACNLLFVMCTFIGVYLPAPDYNAEMNQSYANVFTFAPRILGASLVAFLLGELSNSKVMVWVKERTGQRLLFLRTISSSAVGYVFDTGLFVILAFAGTCPAKDLVSMILVQYFAKLGIEAIFATPLAYGAVAFLRKHAAEPLPDASKE